MILMYSKEGIKKIQGTKKLHYLYFIAGFKSWIMRQKSDLQSL